MKMKKGILVSLGVAALLVLMVWADRKFPAAGRPSANTPSTASEASMPSIVMKDLNDRDVTLSQYKGQVVLVNLWATWCEPCKVEIPWMIEFQKKYSSRGFTILGVSMDEDGWKDVKPYVELKKINYRVVIGDDQTANLYGGVDSLPTTFILDRDGKIAAVHVGLVSKSDYASDIEQVLAK